MLCLPALPHSPQPAAGDKMHLLDWVGRCQELLLPGGDKRTPCPNSLASPKGHAARQSSAMAVPSRSDQPVPEMDLSAGIKKGGAAANPRCDPRVICRGRVLGPTGPGGSDRELWPVLCCAAARRYRSQAGPAKVSYRQPLALVPVELLHFQDFHPAQRFTFLLRGPHARSSSHLNSVCAEAQQVTGLFTGGSGSSLCMTWRTQDPPLFLSAGIIKIQRQPVPVVSST